MRLEQGNLLKGNNKMDNITNDRSAKFLDALEKESKKVLKELGKKRSEIGKALTPKETGEMADANTYTVKNVNGDIEFKLGNTDWKAHFFIFGTEKMRKNDWITPMSEDMDKEFWYMLKERAKTIED